ncbi:unnamed protein product, partial [Rotaria magnacalcarata]
KLLMSDPLFEDLLLNEMPDVGSLRIKAYEQRNLSEDQRDYDLEDKSSDDLAAYEFSFFVNNVLASLVVNCSDEKISIRALKQMHRLTTINLYCQSLASCHMSAPRMIKNITADQWTQQSLTTIQFVIKQISKKIQRDGLFYSILKKKNKFKQILGLNQIDDDGKENFNIIINVFTKVFMIFGKQPFIDRSLCDPLFIYVDQIWFQQFNYDQYQYKIPFLLDGWSSIITKWLKLDYSIHRRHTQQIKDDLFDDDDDD